MPVTDRVRRLISDAPIMVGNALEIRLFSFASGYRAALEDLQADRIDPDNLPASLQEVANAIRHMQDQEREAAE